MEKQKPLVVYLDRELSDWVEGKALAGWKKSGLVRHLLLEQMKKEGGVAQ